MALENIDRVDCVFGSQENPDEGYIIASEAPRHCVELTVKKGQLGSAEEIIAFRMCPTSIKDLIDRLVNLLAEYSLSIPQE